MTGFKAGDWVGIQQHPDVHVEGRTGTVAHETGEPDLFMVHLDKPLHDSTEYVEAYSHELVLLQSRDVIAVVTAADGAAVAAVHDPAGRCVDIVCSEHPDFLTFTYDRGTTETIRDEFRSDAAMYADKHAATRHTATHDATRGETS